jgi:spore maturation protein CgeB
MAMRIFYASPSTAHQEALPNSKTWHVNHYLPLADLGHELVTFDFDYSACNYNLDPGIPAQREFISRNRPRFGEALLAQVRSAHSRKPIDLFFSYFYSAYVEPDIIREIGRMGILTMNWYCNASYQFHLVEEIAPAYNYSLVPEKFRLEDYRRVGANPIYCQEAANPNVYRPYDLPQDYDVTFVGQRYGDRTIFLRHLIDGRIDARAWGPHWQDPYFPSWWMLVGSAVKRLLTGRKWPWAEYVPRDRCGPPLSDKELVEMYSRSKISLGFTTVAEGRIKQVRLRDFEAPMSGAFYMVEHFDDLAEFFDPGKEVVFFESPDDLLDKVRYYLRHDAERQRIREAGMRRARNEHTWHRRFETVFAKIGIS